MSSDLTELGLEARLGLASSCSYAARRPPWPPEFTVPLGWPHLRCDVAWSMRFISF
jgi:hypothetical protein